MTVELVFFQIHIIGVVFLTLRLTFLEKFSLLRSLVSYLNVYHNEMRQNMCGS